MVNETIRLHHLTLEPSDHYIAMMRYLCREFTMNYMIFVVKNLIRLKVTVSNGDLKVEMFTRGKGYVVTAHHKSMNKHVELHIRIISVETDPDVIKAEKNIDNEASLENEIWNELRPILNSINDTIKQFLVNVFGV